MKDFLQDLVQTLRHELQQYGEMLARLDQQQELVLGRRPDELLQSLADIQSQCLAIQNARERREQCQRDLAREFQLGEDAKLSEVLPYLPKDYRPLLQALIDENNELIVRVQQRSRQNHLLLARSLEMMQRLMDMLVPGTRTLYTETGRVAVNGGVAPALYEVVG
ncbi:MAG: flagellar protein FlgN [Verrucomicrobiales bacterium]|nr:flagellar protein FlgN [Verrucomicrobiales bacterium]